MNWNASLIDGPIETDARGYHLNVAAELATDALAAYRVTPKTPSRVFVGADTAFLRFASEAEARAALGAYWNEGEQ